MSQGKAPAVLMPDSETINRLIIFVLIPCGRPAHGFQNHKSYFRHVIARFTFVQLLYPFLTDIPLRVFCLFPIRFVPYPWKESTVRWIEITSSKANPRDQSPFQGLTGVSVSLLSLPCYSGTARFLHTCYYKMMSLISSKVLMNQFQRTFFLIYRKICIFESVLIHRRTHWPVANTRYS